MKKSSSLLLVCLPVLAFAQPAQSSHSAPQDLSVNGEPPMLGVHWARGLEPYTRVREAAKGGDSGKKNPDMTYHEGRILPTTVMQAIFWGTGWAGDSSDKMTGIDAWYRGFSNSEYAKTSDEYTGSNGQVTPFTTCDPSGSILDTSPSADGNSTSAVLAEVCKAVPNPDSSGNGYYAVYSDIRRGPANYCAYHSYGACGGTPVQFAFFFNLDGDAGCDPQDTSGLHSQGLAALANVSGHELSEARTDPASPGAWYDSKGEENGDKCAWTFNVPLVTFSTNGTQWKIQGEWSNNAFDNGTGYPNSSGQKGCLDGSSKTP